MVYCANFTNHRTLLEEVETKTDIDELKLIVKTLVRENRILSHRFNILLKTIKNQNNLINYLQEILESMMAQAERAKNELSCILTELAYCAFDTVMRSQLIINRLAKTFCFDNLQKSELDELNEIAQTVSTEDVNWTQRRLIGHLKKISETPNSVRDLPKNHKRKNKESQLTDEAEEEEITVETSNSPNFHNNHKKSPALQMRRSRKNSTVSVKKQSNHRSKRSSSVSSKRSRKGTSDSERSKRASSVSERSRRASSVSERSRRASSVSEQRSRRASSVSERSRRAVSVSGRSRRASSVFDTNEVTSKKPGRRGGKRKLQERESGDEDEKKIKRQKFEGESLTKNVGNEDEKKIKRQKSERESLTKNVGSSSNDCKVSSVPPLKICVVELEELENIPEAQKYIAPLKTELSSKDNEENDEYEIVDDVDASDEGAEDSDENAKSENSDETRTFVKQSNNDDSDSNSDEEINQDSDSGSPQQSDFPNGKRGPRTPPSPYPYENLRRGPRTPPGNGPDSEGTNNGSLESVNDSEEVFNSPSEEEEENSPEEEEYSAEV